MLDRTCKAFEDKHKLGPVADKQGNAYCLGQVGKEKRFLDTLNMILHRHHASLLQTFCERSSVFRRGLFWRVQ